MKVYIVLVYIITEAQYEHCRIDRVYKTRSRANKRIRCLYKHNPSSDISFHCIEKSVKGKI